MDLTTLKKCYMLALQRSCESYCKPLFFYRFIKRFNEKSLCCNTYLDLLSLIGLNQYHLKFLNNSFYSNLMNLCKVFIVHLITFLFLIKLFRFLCFRHGYLSHRLIFFILFLIYVFRDRNYPFVCYIANKRLCLNVK